MPNAWTAKDERKYDHIRESQMDRGSSERKAEEIAARTVNKHRREEGRTRNRRTMGTGNPRAPLEERTKDELYNLAEDHNIRGRSRMNKNQLITALRRSGASNM
jgi:hypothetical protein